MESLSLEVEKVSSTIADLSLQANYLMARAQM